MLQLLRFFSLIPQMSPETKDAIHKSLADMMTHAKATKNPADDIAVGILITIATAIGLY